MGKNSSESRKNNQARDRQHNRIVKIHGASLMRSRGIVKRLGAPALAGVGKGWVENGVVEQWLNRNYSTRMGLVSRKVR